MDRTGKALIQHVYERVREADRIDRAVVATDDPRILEAVHAFGGEAVLTRRDHPSGTDRVAEVAAASECEMVVNVQGDEPEIEPAHIDRLVSILDAVPGRVMATLACPFSKVPGGDPNDPHCVKVVLNGRGEALYFSRSPIPFFRTSVKPMESEFQPLLHVGIYAYRRDFLLEMSAWPPTPLERAEGLEQLRVLEYGRSIAVGLVEHAAVGIDTPADYEAFVERSRLETGVRV